MRGLLGGLAWKVRSGRAGAKTRTEPSNRAPEGVVATQRLGFVASGTPRHPNQLPASAILSRIGADESDENLAIGAHGTAFVLLSRGKGEGTRHSPDLPAPLPCDRLTLPVWELCPASFRVTVERSPSVWT